MFFFSLQCSPPTSMSETYCLKWKFSDTISQYYQELKESKNFSDVTLACEEGAVFKAHKIILAASSPVFDTILLSSQHSNTFIYMKGIKSEDLSAILDFVCCGKAKIQQSDLINFLLLAEELKIKGLAGEESEQSAQTSDKKDIPDAEMNDSCSEIENIEIEEGFNGIVKDNNDETNEVDKGTQYVDFQSKTVPNERSGGDEDQRTFSVDKISPLLHEKIESFTEQNILFIPTGEIIVDSVEPTPLQEAETTHNAIKIYEQIESMIERYGEYWRCTVCGKLHKIKQCIKNHIECNHLEDGDYLCNVCNKTYRRKRLLEKHLQRKRCFPQAV